MLDGGQILMATTSPGCGAGPCRSAWSIATQGVFVALIVTMFVYLSYSDIRRWTRDAQADQGRGERPSRQVDLRRPKP